MHINGNIFNDIVSINRKLTVLCEDYNVDSDSLIGLEDGLWPIRDEVAWRDADSDERSAYLKQAHGDQDDAKADCASEAFADGSLQLKFVPRDSLLSQGLWDYFDSVSHSQLTYSDLAKYVRSGVATDGPLGFGIYFCTGIGYATNDELFAGLHGKAGDVGSGYPVERFLYYLNYQDGIKSQQKRDLKTLKLYMN